MIESFIKYDELGCRPLKQLKGENVEVPLFGANDKKFATIALPSVRLSPISPDGSAPTFDRRISRPTTHFFGLPLLNMLAPRY